jgi:hypothetical protein
MPAITAAALAALATEQEADRAEKQTEDQDLEPGVVHR